MLLSNELLFLIFQDLTSNLDLYHCALVNKNWNNVAMEPVFFKEINIYSKRQLGLFIKAAKETKIRNEKLMGQHVKKISLHFEDPIHTKTMKKLQQSCPTISNINYSPPKIYKGKKLEYKIISKWPNLIHLPTWHSENIEECLLYLNSTLESFTFNATPDNCNTLNRGVLPYDLNPISQLLCLKELHLDNTDERNTCLSFNANAFEMIHSLCPHLTTLSISNNYIFEMKNDVIESSFSTTLSQSASALASTFLQLPPSPPSYSEPAIFRHQWNTITTLCFKSIKTDSRHFFTFIARNYPNLESLTIENIQFNAILFTYTTIEHFESIQKKMKQAIKQMIIDLSPRLKTLCISFDTSIINIWSKYWANNELLDYFDIYPPTQLKKLKWPSTIYPSDIEKKGVIRSNRLYREIKPIGFIYQLEELHLSLSSISKETLDYLLDGKKIISTNLKHLFIDILEPSLLLQPFPLYNWLNAFPNLQSLSVSRLTLVTQEPFNKNMQQVIQHQSQYKKLQSLTIHQCDLRLEGGFSHLFQRCPQLNHLECSKSNYYFLSSLFMDDTINNKVKEVSNDDESYCYHTFIYAPHINLTTLKLKDMKFMKDDNKPLIYNRILIAPVSPKRKSLKYIINDDNDFDVHDIDDDVFLVIYVNGIEKYCYGNKWLKY